MKKGQNGKQRSTKIPQKPKDRATRNPLKPGVNSCGPPSEDALNNSVGLYEPWAHSPVQGIPLY